MSDRILYISGGGVGAGNILMNAVLILAWILITNEYDKLVLVLERSDAADNFCILENNDKFEISHTAPKLKPPSAKGFLNSYFVTRISTDIRDHQKKYPSPIVKHIHFFGQINLNEAQLSLVKQYFNPQPNNKVVDEMNILKKDIGDYVAVHARGTDHITCALKTTEDKMSYDNFHNFIESHACKSYLATDDKIIKEKLLNKNHDKIFSYDSFCDGKKIGYEIRSTTELSIFVDMFMCRDGKEFIGTYRSTFSDFIHLLRYFKD